MSAYYVIAIVIAVGAIVLSAIGLTREDFPPTVRAGRAVMAGTLLLVIGGVIALLATTHVEHPREEAAEAAAEEKAAEGGGKPAEGGKPAQGGSKAGETIDVTEDEFSIALQGGKELAAGPHTFAVANEGKIEHDLAIEGDQLEDEVKTKLIPPKEAVPLEADLPPGKYKFYCTVPGHEESGMKVDVTVK